MLPLQQLNLIRNGVVLPICASCGSGRTIRSPPQQLLQRQSRQQLVVTMRMDIGRLKSIRRLAMLLSLVVRAPALAMHNTMLISHVLQRIPRRTQRAVATI